MKPTEVSATIESWPLAEEFVISRGAKREAVVVVATLEQGGARGRGECVAYPRYGQAPERVAEQILAADPVLDRLHLQRVLPAGPARNALDCALWDLEAKQTGRRVHELAGIPALRPVLTCLTLSLAAPEAMADAARRLSRLPLLKLKLGGGSEDARRMRAVRAVRPDARLVADANESWREPDLEQLLAVALETGLELIEQPLPAGQDQALARTRRAVPVCADESAHASAGLDALCDRYDAINIKLDKAGGLSEALAMLRTARRLGLRVMAGSMVATSLSMAPAFLAAQEADWVDLDSPLLLARDRQQGMRIQDGWVSPPSPELWG